MKKKRLWLSAIALLVPLLAVPAMAQDDAGGVQEAVQQVVDRPPAAVTGLASNDAPNDAGRLLIVTFERSADDGEGENDVAAYEIYRGDSLISTISPSDVLERTITYSDNSPLIQNGVIYKYRVVTVDSAGNRSEARADGAMASGQWFHTGRVNMLVSIILISAFILYFIRKAQSGAEIYLRPVAGLKAFDEAVGRATEMGKPVLYVPGIMDLDQVETVAGIIILGYVSKMTARYETELEVPVSRSLVMSNAREVCKSSYLSEGRPELFKDDMVHYLTDDQFAYAAGVDGIMLRKKPAACFYQGKFYAESLILAETGNSIGAIQIAGTASPTQLPFFITACDYTLIGEEFFAASAYLSQDPKLVGSLKGQDWGKAMIMLIIIVGTIVETLHALGIVPFTMIHLLEAG